MGMIEEVKQKKKKKAAENWIKMGDSAKTVEKQIEYYTKSLDMNPYNAEAWFKKGKSFEKMENFESAKRCFDLAVEIEPDYIDLIEKGHESSDSSEAYPIEEEEEEEATSGTLEDDLQTEEEDNSKPWISEQSDIVPDENLEINDNKLDDKNSSFRPPSGDESAFSNVFTGNDEDDKQTAPKSESDETFKSQVPLTVETDPSSFGNDENVPESNHPKEYEAEPTYGLSEDRTPYAKDEAEISAIDTDSPIETFKGPTNTESSESMSFAGENSTSGDDLVDIRIPLDEAIKFWAIGIVAMIIVLGLSKLI